MRSTRNYFQSNFQDKFDVDTVVDKPVNENFTSRMKKKYIKYAKNVIERGSVINKAKTRIMNYSKSSIGSEGSSDFFDHDAFYEGGEDDPAGKTKGKREPQRSFLEVFRQFRGLNADNSKGGKHYYKKSAMKKNGITENR